MDVLSKSETLTELRSCLEKAIDFARKRDARNGMLSACDFDGFAVTLREIAAILQVNCPLRIVRRYENKLVSKLDADDPNGTGSRVRLMQSMTSLEWANFVATWEIPKAQLESYLVRNIVATGLRLETPGVDRELGGRVEMLWTSMVGEDGRELQTSTPRLIREAIDEKLSTWVMWIDAGVPGITLIDQGTASKASMPKGRRGRKSNEAKDIETLEDFERWCKENNSNCITQFAKERVVARDTISKRIDRGRIAKQKRESNQRRLKRTR